MKVTYSWLSELVEGMPSPDELADLFIMRGFEVEEATSPGDAIRDVVIGEIVEMGLHPNAEKLTFCHVTDGQETHPIVCGATNHKTGDRVALARVGTTLPGDFKIEKRKIRGEVSKGMMCSLRELGMGEEHAGILILPKEAPLGGRLVDYLGLNDVVFDISVTPNRPDALSAIGLAREAAAACGGELRLPDMSELEAALEPDFAPSVTLEADDLCPRYTALTIRDVTIGPSPDWLRNRLEACGVRSINNVVDATNLVMMESGQPLHAFDMDLLAEERIVVRRAHEGERFKTLDGEERVLTTETLVIADAEKAVALAGVMGGEESEVTQGTRTILLESAFFHPPSIRRTSKRQTLSTESSYRFERGVDLETVVPAAWRCARLIVELAGGKIAGRITVADTPESTRLERLREREMSLRFAYCERLLGKRIDPEEIERLLASVFLPTVQRDAERLTVKVPSFRQDIQREADLVEEVARCHGYNEFTPTPLLAPVRPPERIEIDRRFTARIHEFFNSAGLDEAITYSFVNEDRLTAFPPTDVARDSAATTILNPINVQERAMRTSLLPSLLLCAQRNVAHGAADFGLYEIARVYLPSEDTHVETMMLAGVICGAPHSNWRDKRAEFDFFDLKGIIVSMLGQAGLKRYRLEDGPDCLHPHRGVWTRAGKKPIGYFGELHPALAEEMDLTGRVCVFEFELAPLARASESNAIKFKPYSPYPAMRRDLAFLLPDGLSARQVEDVIRQEGGELLEDARLFDYYKGKQVAEGHASVAFRLLYRSAEGTLKEETVDALGERVLNRLQSELNVKLRT